MHTERQREKNTQGHVRLQQTKSARAKVCEKDLRCGSLLGTTPARSRWKQAASRVPAAEAQRAEKSAVGERRQRRVRTSEREGSRDQTYHTRKTGTTDTLDGVRS